MMPKAADDPARQLKIKHGVCKRMIKEAAYYKKEAGQNEARVQKMKDDGIDPWTVKKAEEVLGESYMMIPDSEKRLKESIEDLFAFMQEFGEDGEVKEAADFEPAQKMLDENAALLES